MGSKCSAYQQTQHICSLSLFPSSLSSSVFQISLSQSVSQSFPDSRPVEKLARASGFYFIPSLSSPFIVAPLLSLRSADNPPFLHRVDGKCRGASIRTPLPWHPLPLTYWLGTVLKDGHVSAIKEPSFTSPSGVPEEGVHQGEPWPAILH